MDLKTSSNILRTVFKDTSKIENLVSSGLRCRVMGRDVSLYDAGVYSKDTSSMGGSGMRPWRLYFVFDDPGADVVDVMEGISLRCVDVNLQRREVDPAYSSDTPSVAHEWTKLNVETNYPWECYVYLPEGRTIKSPVVYVPQSMMNSMFVNVSSTKVLVYFELHHPDSHAKCTMLSSLDRGSFQFAVSAASDMIVAADSQDASRILVAVISG